MGNSNKTQPEVQFTDEQKLRIEEINRRDQEIGQKLLKIGQLTTDLKLLKEEVTPEVKQLRLDINAFNLEIEESLKSKEIVEDAEVVSE